MSADEVAGLRLFMGPARCASCHNGPLFSNHEFHNIGAPEADTRRVDLGRHAGVRQLQASGFSCLSRWSDARPSQCEEMRFLKTQGPELVGAFKTPSLRNVAATAPYMQAGQFTTLEAVLAHYNAPKPPYFDPAQHPNRPHFDILPLQLGEAQIHQLIAFLGTLSSPVPADDRWWAPPSESAR
jgi:cytochrome c peroxidase